MKYLEQYLTQKKHSINGSCVIISPVTTTVIYGGLKSLHLPLPIRDSSGSPGLFLGSLLSLLCLNLFSIYPNPSCPRRPNSFCTPAVESPWFPLLVPSHSYSSCWGLISNYSGLPYMRSFGFLS